jgi:hypothetical protein
MNMADHLLVERINEAFVGCELPDYFTEHEPHSCWQCADAEHTLRNFVGKWGKKRFFMRGIGADLLFLNVEGFKFLAPRLVGFALSGLPGSNELLTDVVEAYGLNALENDQGDFSQKQKESLKDFALSELIAHRQKFVKLGFDNDEIDELKRRWRSIRV